MTIGVNPILMMDSYKASHYRQYPPGTERVSSYIEARRAPEGWDGVQFFGLQILLKEVLSRPFTRDDVEEAEEVLTAHGVPFNRQGWDHILNRHGGFMPIEITAVPEGSVIPVQNVLAQVENTDDGVPWITSYLETALLRAVWYPTTVTTLSRQMKREILASLRRTSDNPEEQIAFRLHDFGARGVSSGESAGVGGLAHLVNFLGTDTVEALLYGRRYYGETMAGFSIPASEHSTMTAWGREGEADAYANMLECFSGEGKLVACVSDSYDIRAACRDIWGDALKDQVLASGGTLVVRPDSGEPTEIVPDVLDILENAFGSTTNSMGYKVLHPSVRVVQGDGIDTISLPRILAAIENAGFSTENVAFGMGGGLLQHVNRDTLGFAMKASAVRVGGHWRDIYKKPVTDPDKISKRGRLSLVSDGAGVRTVRLEDAACEDRLLSPVFRNGEVLRSQTLSDVRDRASANL